MTRLEKIQLAIKKGITCDINTGKVYGVRGNELTRKKSTGYKVIIISIDKKFYNLLQHQFIYFIANNKIVDVIDHINGNKEDNRIENLREVTTQQNQHNLTKARGYYLYKNKWLARISLNRNEIYLGYFDTELEAREAYLEAKKIYHII